MGTIDPPPLSQAARRVALTLAGSLLLHVVALAWLPPPTRPAQGALPSLLEVRLLVPAPTEAVVPQPAVWMKSQASPQAAPARVVSAAEAAAPVPASVVSAPSALPAPDGAPLLRGVPEAQPLPEPRPVADAQPWAEPITPPDLRAAYLSNPRPPYPLAARRRGLEGRVVLKVEVLEDGSCGRLSVSRSSGHELLDQAALEAVKQWRFVPAHRGGAAVVAWVEVPIVFRLEDGARGAAATGSSADPAG